MTRARSSFHFRCKVVRYLAGLCVSRRAIAASAAKSYIDVDLLSRVYEFLINVVSSGKSSTDWTMVRSTAGNRPLGPDELATCFL